MMFFPSIARLSSRRAKTGLFFITALASADALLTLDKKDFASVMGEIFYGLAVLLPYDFLERERTGGRLRVDTL